MNHKGVCRAAPANNIQESFIPSNMNDCDVHSYAGQYKIFLMTLFQIKGGSLVQGVTKLITTFSA